MDATLIPVVAIVLGCAIPIVAIIVDHFTKKSKMQVMEKAIEKGLPLEGLSLEEKKKPRGPYRSGMIALAVGIGIGIFAFFMRNIAQEAFYSMLGLASIPALIGIVLIINDRINYDRYFNKESDQQ
jgi:hypothetical protein